MHCCFLHFKWKNIIYQFRTLPFGLPTAPRSFTRVMRPISLHCQKMRIIQFLYLDNVVILAESFSQARVDGERVTSLLQRLGFILSHNRCQAEPTEVFTHLFLRFSIGEMTISLHRENVQMVKAQASRVVLSHTCRDVMGLLGLTSFSSMALPPSKVSLMFPPVLAEANIKVSSQFFWNHKFTQEAQEALLVAVLLCATAKVDTSTPSPGMMTGVWTEGLRVHEQPVL